VMIASITIALLFELGEDYFEDGELNHSFGQYAGAFATGFFGGLSGGAFALIGWSMVGGVADYVLSGNFNEDTFLKDMAVIGITSILSVGIGYGLKRVASGLKANSIMKLGSNNLSNRALGGMGFTALKVGHRIAGAGGLTVGKSLGKILYQSGKYFGGEMIQTISTGVSSQFIDDTAYLLFD